jgi:cation:H+ antiporter
MTRLWGGFATLAALVFAAGWLLARLGDSIAQQTGLGGGVVGMLMLAVATSLPEISTTLSAALHGNVTMAISNIFGSCLFDVALLFLTGVLSAGPVVRDARSAVFVAALGVTMTAVYLWGLLEHRQRTILRLGVDSVMVLVLYVVGAVGVVTLAHQEQAKQGASSGPVLRIQHPE